MRKLSLLLGLVLLVHGVFGVDEVKSVSVMVGDSLTLNSDFTETKGDELQWRIEGESNVLAQIDREVNKFLVPGNNEERFRGRLKLDHQTGSLTITNIRNTDSGEYELKIKDSMNENNYRFTVTVRDVFSDEEDGVKTVSETMGDSVLLHTHVTHIQQNDPIEWTFGTQNIPLAKTDGMSYSISYNYNDEIFKNRLYLDIRTGDLTIKKSSTEHSGLYQLKIITSSYTIQKSFRVAVSGSGRSSAVSVLSGASVLMIWATVFLLQEV